MNVQPDAAMWGQVRDIRVWRDRTLPVDDRVQVLSLRIHAIAKELGEVSHAFAGVTVHHPGMEGSCTEAELAAELCDVVLAAQVALATLTKDPAGIYRRHLARAHARSMGAARRV